MHNFPVLLISTRTNQNITFKEVDTNGDDHADFAEVLATRKQLPKPHQETGSSKDLDFLSLWLYGP